jgi:hypothetical protein
MMCDVSCSMGSRQGGAVTVWVTTSVHNVIGMCEQLLHAPSCDFHTQA